MASKIVKSAGAQPDEFELSVAQALVDLESSIPELRALYITAAKEVSGPSEGERVLFMHNCFICIRWRMIS